MEQIMVEFYQTHLIITSLLTVIHCLFKVQHPRQYLRPCQFLEQPDSSHSAVAYVGELKLDVIIY